MTKPRSDETWGVSALCLTSFSFEAQEDDWARRPAEQNAQLHFGDGGCCLDRDPAKEQENSARPPHTFEKVISK